VLYSKYIHVLALKVFAACAVNNGINVYVSSENHVFFPNNRFIAAFAVAATNSTDEMLLQQLVEVEEA